MTMVFSFSLNANFNMTSRLAPDSYHTVHDSQNIQLSAVQLDIVITPRFTIVLLQAVKVGFFSRRNI